MPRLSKIGAAALAAFGWTSGGAGAVTASYLIVAGGGSGASGIGGGGGAGGLLTGTTSLSGATTYTIVVGAGGAGISATTSYVNGNVGSNSSAFSLTASGGGYGGTYNNVGGNGGSGGGGGTDNKAGGTAVSGQGYAGGTSNNAYPQQSGGGGGAGGAGANATNSNAGAGGIGVSSSITGTATYYAGGGGGSFNADSSGAVGAGGLGGGTAGGNAVASASATANTGGGSGGGGYYSLSGGNTNKGSGNGGSGVVIVSYPAPQIFWGGFVTTSGGNIIHTFTTSGSLTPVSTTVSANYLVVAGGGSGASVSANGNGCSGGGGAGGYLASTTTLSLSSSYTVTVGAGGAAVTGNAAVNANGIQGSNSSLGSIATAIGGGFGASSLYNPSSGGNGGSGGGGSPYGGISSSGGTGTVGQGNNGGTSDPTYGGGGGGGASSAGGNGSSGSSGAGGNGTASSISGSSVTYAGGGGGGGRSSFSGASGGTGGGGTGGNVNAVGNNGTANLGGGGGGSGCGGGTSVLYSGAGGSGVVIISYAGQQLFGGGVVTFVNGNTIHTFNTSGTLTPLSQLSADYLIVAGGGGSGGSAPNYVASGGAGAGGLLQGSGLAIDTASTYLVTVGAGGAAGSSGFTNGNNGGNSSFSVVPTQAVGGALGQGYNQTSAIGGSGGGGANNSQVGSAGTAGQGNAGGNGGVYSNSNATQGAGGGGGAGAVGGNFSGTGSGGSNNGGAGGVGIASSISGTSTYYAGGGGGGAATGTGGAGGSGGGGAGNSGWSATGSGTAGTANTGGGGGGSSSQLSNSYAGAAGGSGIVIIRYAGSTQLMAGGTVTITGGYVIHTFTSSGYLAPLKYVGNSLRFRASNSAYLSRTPTVAGSRTTWTFSAWVKRGNLSLVTGAYGVFGCAPSGNEDTLRFDSATAGNQINFYVYTGGYVGQLNTTASYRDPAAWYHIVAVWDTTNATSTERMRLYVNGVRVTAFGTATYPSQNAVSNINNNVATQIGWYSPSGSNGYYDGEMTEINFVDGQALTPNSFGAFNSYGVWQPITYGGSYGTNGFYLPFTASQSYSASFNGSSQYLTATSSTAFNFGSGDFTVEGWFYAISKPVAHQAMIQKGSATVNNAYDWRLYWGNVSTNQIWFDCAAFSFSGYASSNNLTLNAWNHIAVVRSGSSAYMFVNGQPAYGATTASGSITNTYSDVVLGAANLGGAGQTYFNGYMSNVRIVKGTAVYTSAFIPSTTPLTAITNTQLLTLQNATIVDNSTNALSIANTGSVVTAGVYPFAYLVNTVKDQGPAGNNWTANNIGQISGSTLDTMTDVPTLTSTTAANYATVNPLDQSDAYRQISNANLTFGSSANSWESFRSTIGMTSGQFYCEMTCQTVLQSGYYQSVGIANASGFASLNYLAATSLSYVYDGRALKYANGGSSTSYGATYTNGDVIGIALDLTAGTLTFYKNGVSQGVAYSGLDTTQTWFFGVSCYTTSGSFNFGQQPWAYTPPAGFVGLNTYNM